MKIQPRVSETSDHVLVSEKTVELKEVQDKKAAGVMYCFEKKDSNILHFVWENNFLCGMENKKLFIGNTPNTSIQA